MDYFLLLFEFCLLVYEKYPDLAIDLQHPGFKTSALIEKLDYPLTLVVTEQSEALDITLKFCQNHLSHQAAEALLKQMIFILQQVVCDVDAPVDFRIAAGWK